MQVIIFILATIEFWPPLWKNNLSYLSSMGKFILLNEGYGLEKEEKNPGK